MWEVAGTPIESSLDNDRGYIVVRIAHAKDSDQLDGVEIFDEKGQLVEKYGKVDS